MRAGPNPLLIGLRNPEFNSWGAAAICVVADEIIFFKHNSISRLATDLHDGAASFERE
jgi:hypothetical protein